MASEEFSISTVNEAHAVAKPTFDRVPFGERFPHNRVHRLDPEHELCDFLECGSCPMTIDGLEHLSQIRSLQRSQPRVFHSDGIAKRPVKAKERINAVA